MQTTDGRIFLTMMSPTAPHGFDVLRLRRRIEAQAPEVMALTGTTTGDPLTGLTKVPDLMVIAEEDTDDDPSDGPDGTRYHKTVPHAFGDTVGPSIRAASRATPPTGRRTAADVPKNSVNAEKPRTSFLVRGFPTMIVRRRPTLPQGPP
ncbi:hypothetical protein ACFWCL_39140, partial [Streptomyces sp. NPDC060075]